MCENSMPPQWKLFVFGIDFLDNMPQFQQPHPKLHNQILQNNDKTGMTIMHTSQGVGTRHVLNVNIFLLRHKPFENNSTLPSNKFCPHFTEQND